MRASTPVKKSIKDNTLEIIIDDITNIDVDAFVFYAREDLEPGSGFGTAIKIRGGIEVRKELDEISPLNVTEAVITTAGNMRAKYIVHAVGPKFHEENTEYKLNKTIINALIQADKKGAHSIAFPLMGAGFYGVPLEESARITVSTISEYLKSNKTVKNILICANDSREYKPALNELAGLN